MICHSSLSIIQNWFSNSLVLLAPPYSLDYTRVQNGRKAKNQTLINHVTHIMWTEEGRGPLLSNTLDFIIRCSTTRQNSRCSHGHDWSVWLVRKSLTGFVRTYLLLATLPLPPTLQPLTLFLTHLLFCFHVCNKAWKAWELGYTLLIIADDFLRNTIC